MRIVWLLLLVNLTACDWHVQLRPIIPASEQLQLEDDNSRK